jgi:predicted nucleic acid-binding Zn ribbon protein
MTSYRRSPRPLALVLDPIRDELEPDSLLAEVQRAWRAAVGAAIAGEAQPTAERAGVVTVSCSASVWAQELDLMAPAIIERLNGLLRSGRSGASGRVSRLRCVATPPRTY